MCTPSSTPQSASALHRFCPLLSRFAYIDRRCTCPGMSWAEPFPLHIAPKHGVSGLHLIHGSLGPPESTSQTMSSSVQPFLRGSRRRELTIVTDRPTTDHATLSVTIGRIYVLRCNLIIYTTLFTISGREKKTKRKRKLECGPMPNVMAALPNIGGTLCSTPQSLADAHYLTALQ